MLGVIAPVHNEPGCATAACHAHPASENVLGVLDVQLPLARVDADLAASERQILLGVVMAVLALLALAWLLTWRMVLRPVARSDARRAARGRRETSRSGSTGAITERSCADASLEHDDRAARRARDATWRS